MPTRLEQRFGIWPVRFGSTGALQRIFWSVQALLDEVRDRPETK